MSAPRVCPSHALGFTSPTATSRPYISASRPASQRETSSSTTPVRVWPISDSTFTLKAVACFMVALPSRIVLRLPSGATKRMRLKPFGSLPMLAIKFLPFLSLRSQRQFEVGDELVRHVEPERLLASHEAHQALPENARFLFQRLEGQATFQDRAAKFISNWSLTPCIHVTIITSI